MQEDSPYPQYARVSSQNPDVPVLPYAIIENGAAAESRSAGHSGSTGWFFGILALFLVLLVMYWIADWALSGMI